MNVKVYVKIPGSDILKETILPETALDSVKRVQKENLKDFHYVDDEGKRIRTQVPERRDPKIIAFQALQERAKELKIPGFAKMNEETLLKAVQTKMNAKK